MYLIRLSQCKIQQSFQVAYLQDNLYHIKPFIIMFSELV